MDDFSAIESPEVETEGLETEQVEGVEQESAEGQESTEQKIVEPTTAADTWKQAKEALKDHPALHGMVKKALHHMETFNKSFPEGVQAATKRLELINQLDDNPDDPEYVPGSTAIEDVISNTIAERSFWRDFDRGFQGGDEKVINQMVEANPGSFQKLIPIALDRYAEMNPDGYSTLVSQSVSSYFASAQIPLQMALLQRVLPESSQDPGLQTVIDAFKAIKGVFDGIDAASKRQIEVKQGQQPQQEQNQGVDHQTREMNLRHDEWLNEIRPRSESFTVGEVQKQFPGKRFTPAEVSSIRNAVKEEVNARVRTNLGYQSKIKSLLKAGNKSAYAMTVESEHKKIIPGAVKRAVNDVLDKRKGAGTKKVVPNQNGQQRTQTQGQQVSVGDDFEQIAQSPARLGLSIDFRRTSNEMLAKNRAFIVGREKGVRWKR